MNGRLDPPSPSLSDDSVTGDRWRPAPADDSFLLSLGCSCALHLIILFLPVFGTIARFAPPDSPDPGKASAPLSVTLASFDRVRAEDRHPPVDSPAPAELPRPAPKPVTSDPLKPTDSRMDSSDLLPLPGIIYYPTSFLTARPQPLAEANLDPPRIRPIVASGKIILTVWINPFGKTAKVVVGASDLPANFVEVAVAAFEGLRFTPGELHGQKVGTVMKVEVTYDDGRLIKTEILQ